MSNQTINRLSGHGAPARFRTVRWPIRAYVVISVLTVVVIFVLSKSDPSQVNPDTWVRGILIAHRVHRHLRPVLHSRHSATDGYSRPACTEPL
jgi:hypothetical protein